ncbi:MAG: ABC transporter permease [Clostridia bacterium]|nr:ABC transporter permease [Clostridia bacterium]
MATEFERNHFKKRLTSMLKVDLRRMFTTPLFYIMVGASLVVPILILVMTTMMAGPTTDPTTGEVTVIESFTNVWQIISSASGSAQSTDASAGAGMDMMAMCNMNLIYFAVAVLVCLFVADDFRSGYAKNLFTVRAKKTDYVISKTLVCFVGGASMILGFFIGAMLGGGIAGLSFDLSSVGSSVGGIVMCLLAKMLLISVFVSIFLIMSVVAKQKVWLSILLSLGVGMFLFMMIPMMTPLNATLLHVILCLAGGALFSVGLGAVSNVILKKTSLI